MLRMRRIILFIAILCAPLSYSSAQCDTVIKPWLRSRIDILADSSMHGRGYVKEGKEEAANYIRKQFKKYHLKPVAPHRAYRQSYYFPVNVFPGRMEVTFNGKRLVPGQDYIVDAGSSGFNGDNLPFEKVDLSTIKDKEQWRKLLNTFRSYNKIYYLEHVDSICALLKLKKTHFSLTLPVGCYVVPQKEKFIWTVSRETTHATVIYVKDSLFDHHLGTLSVHIDARLLKDVKNDNIVGVLRGEVKDTFIAITAHYDHLGMMGGEAIFPGASDNASGTAMMLYMARYFARHKHHYSILFIAFSGEEAGLMGSEYFTKHPLVPLSQIKFLTNVDIMGDATDGITVVNATEYPRQFELLEKINSERQLLPQIKSRGKAANSDHYHFSEAGVPSFFIYTNGGKGYYHDIYDKPGEITLNNVDNIVKLVIAFLKEIK
jgi:aminopeptidase YwaD